MYAQEFTPELSQSFLANQLNLSSNNEAAEVGRAHEEGEEGGLVGQAAEGSRVGAATDNANRNVNDTVTRFNTDVAGKQYSERMTDEREAFQDTERQKTEAFQQSMEQLGYSQRVQSKESDNRFNKISAYQGLALGTLTGSATSYGGGYKGAQSSGGGGDDKSGNMGDGQDYTDDASNDDALAEIA